MADYPMTISGPVVATIYPLGVGAGVADSDDPEIDNLVPTEGTVLAENDAVTFDVIDNVNISSCVVWVDISGKTEVVYGDDTDFAIGYLSGSTVTSLSNGLRFAIRRTNGWQSAFVVHVVAGDFAGNVLVTSWSYLVEAPTVVPVVSDVYALEREDDHAAYAKSRLLEFYKLPRMEAYLESIVGLLQPLEDLCWQLLEERYLEAISGNGPAEGTQLDGLGLIVGESRGNADDDTYRAFISVKILINRSTGKIEELYDILVLLGCDTYAVIEDHPAKIDVYATNVQYYEKTRDAVLLWKPAGVGIGTLYFSTVSAANTFTLSDQYGTETFSDTQGLSSEYGPVIGGKLAGDVI
jgi:hypothetical protein